jgi:5-methylthioadenosine/S-adenosylhomocysteine deaminase
VSADRFELRYAEGVPAEEPAAERPALELSLRPSEPFALRGCVVTPARVIDPGWVVVSGATLGAVQDSAPADMRVLDTGGLILPGLIDLHGHPEYDVFAAWEPPKLYRNRYAWRGSKEYDAIVKEPWHRLTDDAPGQPSLLRELTRYAEVRALVGGATAIQGASAKYPDKSEALVRNVDLRIFGEHKARSIIDLGRTDEAECKRLRAAIDAGEVTALYVHLAEGTNDDPRSEKELDALETAQLLTPATVIIHGTALDRDRLARVKAAGAKLVWSPQSNLRLYGQTTRAVEALGLEIPLGIGADWLPSGSPSLLAELRVARRALRDQGMEIEPRRLVQMVTAGAAAIAGLDGKLGELAEGRAADVLVLARAAEDPWESVLVSDPGDVELVVVGGDVAYGRPDWVGQLAPAPADVEQIVAWGKPMTLDTSYSVAAGDSPPPRLADLRAALLGRYPQVGPIFA